jgi:hypothetical protein
MTQIKETLLFPLLSIMLGFLMILILLEVVFRLMPTSDYLEHVPINEQSPIKHFVPDRKVFNSKNPNFSITNEIYVNNYGFINNQVYTKKDDRPLLAVIGDSYVEAAIVPYEETLHGILANILKNNGRIYSFGTSGSALSQYLAYAKFVRTEFRPDGMVFIIIANDFDEALCKYKSSPTLHCFQKDLQNRLVLTRKDWQPNQIAKLLRYSALYRRVSIFPVNN